LGEYAKRYSWRRKETKPNTSRQEHEDRSWSKDGVDQMLQSQLWKVETAATVSQV
jgi:hypothetical protein